LSTWVNAVVVMAQQWRRFVRLVLLLLRLVGVVLVVLLPRRGCHGQEAPFYNISAFDYSRSVRTGLCTRQRLNQAGNITLAQALRGLPLSVVFLNYSDPFTQRFFTLDEGQINPDRPMLFVTVMDELARRAGFTWRNSYGVVNPLDLANNPKNRTYTDLLDWQVSTYDISAGRWDKSLRRIQRSISFPEGFYDASVIMVNDDNSKVALQIWSVFLPFRWTVWLLTLATIVTSGLVYYVIENLNNKADRCEHKPGEAIYYAALSFTGHFDFHPRSAPSMIMSFSLTFASLLFTAVYTANLASFLVLRRQPRDFVANLAEATFRQVPICIQDQTNSYELVKRKHPSAHLVPFPTQDDVYKALRNKTCSVAVDTTASFQQYKRSALYNRDCRLNWSGKVEDFLHAGFATAVDSGVQCTSLISSVLDLHFLAMEADGFIDRQWQNHLNRIGAPVCGVESSFNPADDYQSGGGGHDETYSLGLTEMAGIYIIHGVLMAVSLVIAVLTKETKKQLSRRSQRLNEKRSRRCVPPIAAADGYDPESSGCCGRNDETTHSDSSREKSDPRPVRSYDSTQCIEQIYYGGKKRKRFFQIIPA
jgi:ABC-type amino acid transport substrate-binding protein